MIKDYLISILQNKNFLMFVTSVMFMTGILAYFNDCEIVSSVIISILGLFLILVLKINIKYVLLWIFIFYLGFFNSFFRIKSSDDLYDIAPKDALISGQIVSIPNTVDDRTKFFLKVNTVNDVAIKAKSYVTLNGQNDFNIGDFISFEGKIRRPFKAGNPSQFDYGKYLRNYNAFTTIYAESSDSKLMNEKMPLTWIFMQKINNLRISIVKTHSKYLQSPNLEILGGIVFGDDAIAPPDFIKSSFVNSGLLHILAASGMNVAFIFGFWFYIMRFLRVSYRINIIGGIVMVILYTLMTGMGASVLRAALMLLFIQIGKLIDRDAHSVSLLSFVAMLLLLYNPAMINDVGFQLSFVVTFGLLTTAKVLFDKTNGITCPEWIRAGFLIPVVAQIWVIPIQMFYFNTVSTYSIIANVLTVPFLSVISFGGFLSSILAVINPIADFVCRVFDFVLKYALDAVVFISDFFSHLPNSLLKTTHPSVIQILLYYAIVLLITVIIQIGYNKKLGAALCSIVIVLLLSTINIPDKNLEIITFDVGNADAFLIKTPQNKYFIIDTAKQSYKSKNSTARLVISKYLTDKGVKDIEGMVLTHFDLDHAGGAVDLMNDLNIKKVYVNSLDKTNYTIIKIFDTIAEKNISTALVKNNTEMHREKDLRMINYIANLPAGDNENSIITLLSYKDFDMLFTGDAGVESYNKIKSDLPDNIEVLKVGHHGGRNVVNKDMVESLGIETSIISTGPNNFGHPDKMTLDILRNTNIYRTDRHNSVKIKTNGQMYRIYTFDRLKRKYIPVR